MVAVHSTSLVLLVFAENFTGKNAVYAAKLPFKYDNFISKDLKFTVNIVLSIQYTC